MAKYSATIQYNIKTTLDAKGLSQLNGQLQAVDAKLRQMASKALISDTQAQKDRIRLKGHKRVARRVRGFRHDRIFGHN